MVRLPYVFLYDYTKCNKRKLRKSWNCKLILREGAPIKTRKLNNVFMNGVIESFDKISFENTPEDPNDSFTCMIDEDGYTKCNMAFVTNVELKCGFIGEWLLSSGS